jgi:hypothetical protein
LSGVESGLSSSLGGTAGSSLANSLGNAVGTAVPYAGVAAIGMEQASAGEAKDAQYSAQEQALGQPSINESNTLLGNYNSGTLTPAQQNVVNTDVSQGNQIIQSAQGLSQIAQTAFANYNSGTLNAADQLTLNNTVAAQKQQVAQQLASAGITDSTILAAQYQQIDNNAIITKQNMLNNYFNTGSTAYNQWLTSTTQGQQTIQNGMEYASTSLQTDLTNSMQEANIGIGEVNTAIQTQMSTDANYAAQVSTLLGTLATAYAKQVAGQKSTSGTTAGTAAGTAAGAAAAKGAAGAATGAANNTANSGGGNADGIGGGTGTGPDSALNDNNFFSASEANPGGSAAAPSDALNSDFFDPSQQVASDSFTPDYSNIGGDLGDI